MSHQRDYYLLDILSIGSWFARNNPRYEVHSAALATAKVQHFIKTNVGYWICLGLPCTPACLPLSLPKRANKNKVVVCLSLRSPVDCLHTPSSEEMRWIYRKAAQVLILSSTQLFTATFLFVKLVRDTSLLFSVLTS